MLPEPTLPSEPRQYGGRLFLMATDRRERDEWWRALRLAISNAGIIAGFAASLGVDDEFAKNAESPGFMPSKIDAASMHAGTENATGSRGQGGNVGESEVAQRYNEGGQGGLSELARARASAEGLRESARRTLRGPRDNLQPKRPVCRTYAMEEEQEQVRARRRGIDETL